MSSHNAIEPLLDEMQRQFGIPPEDVRIVRSPYRICPLGAHIDHQLGRVTAMALNRAVLFAYAVTEQREVRLRSVSFENEVRFSLDDVPSAIRGDWGNFPRGAVTALKQAGYQLRNGITGITSGNLAEGGLSSSAAAGVAYLLALEEANGLPLSAWENIELDRQIENGYLGLRNGILDQSAILLSRAHELTVIDCKAHEHQMVAPGAGMPDFAILIAFSGLRQSLVTTGYNTRVAECAEAAGVLLKAVGRPSENPLLGLVSPGEYEAFKDLLEGDPAKRARHFFSEMARVEQGIKAWANGDVARFGELVTASGLSSIENYECGCKPLMDLYRILVETPGVYGARFSGAGFRGCCVALVDPAQAAQAVLRVEEEYQQRHPELAINAPVFVCHSDDGARILEPDWATKLS